MMNIDSEQDIYARHLTCAEPKRGYPLWCPDVPTQLPSEYRCGGYRIGDVGVVTGHGSFDVFFNICLPSSHPLHSPYGVPEGFEQIGDLDVESFEDFDKRGRVVSTTTNLAEVAGASTSTSEFVHSITCLDDLTVCSTGCYLYKLVSVNNSTRLHRKAQFWCFLKDRINTIFAITRFFKRRHS